MKATLLGHACWLFETAGGNILTDPVFFDPFEQGTVTSCPTREIDLARLPRLDALYLSHRHIDHFDFPSLDRLDRSVPIFCPDDPLMIAGLRELGFTTIRPLAPFTPLALGDTELIAVPSYSDELEEFGVIVRDPSGAVFNQVDCPLTSESIARIGALVPRLDVHLSMFASQNFAFFESRSDDVTAMYASNLGAALSLGARVVVPGSAGFRFVDEIGWLNRHLFPISSTRFTADLKRLDPTRRTEDLLPGDVLEVSSATVQVHRAASPFARTVTDDRHLLDYDASAPIPPLEDTNATGYPPAFLGQFAQGFLDNTLAPWVSQLELGQDDVASEYMRHHASYELDLILPDGTHHRRVFAFTPAGCTVHAGDDAPPGDVIRRIAASAVADVASGRKSAFYARTRSRRSSLVIATAIEDGRLTFDDVRLDDLLMHFLVALRRQAVGEARALREYLGLYPPEALIGAAPSA